ncbi:hypothetical protein CV770_06995 [Bradyrhizobium sp. AC87j1]|nr:hypothetical protein CV770_06995 [Bradyrhizobium sp. AC87j1]
MPRLDRGIQYAAADTARANFPMSASGILDRPPADDDSECVAYDNRISSSRLPSPFSSFFTALDATTSPSLA